MHRIAWITIKIFMIGSVLRSKKYPVLIAVLILCIAGVSLWFLVGRRYGDSRDAPSLLAETLRQCQWGKRDTDYYACFRKHVRPAVQMFGVQKTISALEEFYRQQISLGESARNVACHEEMHIISEVGVDLTDVPEQVFAACTSACGYGCHHGAALALLRKNGGSLEGLSAMCGTIRRRGSSFPGQEGTACYHGIGHGLADLAGRDVKKALALCSNVGDRQGEDECATGVFMELFDAPTFDQKRLALPADLMAFCKSLPAFGDVCVKSAGGYEFRRSHSAIQAFATCRNAPSDMQHSCAVGIGSDFHFLFQGDAGKGVDECMIGNELASPCLDGLLISSFVSDRSGNAGVHYCQMVSRADLRRSCFQYLGNSAEQLGGPEGRERVCRDTGQDAPLCRTGSKP